MSHERIAPIPTDKVAEVWELVQRDEHEFMPRSPRPVVRLVGWREAQTPIRGASVVVGVAETPFFPVSCYIRTHDENGQMNQGYLLKRVELLQELIHFGIDSPAGEKRIVTAKEFPGKTVHHFLARTPEGLVVQPYEKVNDEDHAEYPTVLRGEELADIADFLDSVPTDINGRVSLDLQTHTIDEIRARRLRYL